MFLAFLDFHIYSLVFVDVHRFSPIFMYFLRLFFLCFMNFIRFFDFHGFSLMFIDFRQNVVVYLKLGLPWTIQFLSKLYFVLLNRVSGASKVTRMQRPGAYTRCEEEERKEEPSKKHNLHQGVRTNNQKSRK